MERKAMALRAAIAVYAFFWFGGIGAYLIFGAPPDHVAWSAPAFLCLAGALALYFADTGSRIPLALAGLAGWLVEVAGIHTGYPFGGYHYTEALPPRVFGAPIAMTPAWIVLLAYVRSALARRSWNRWGLAAAGAVWMTTIDLVLDPVAAGPMGLWVWDNEGAYYGIPASNFLGWFVVSFVILAALPQAPGPRPALERLGGSIVLFFIVLAALKSLWLALIPSAALAIAHWLACREAPPSTSAPPTGKHHTP